MSDEKRTQMRLSLCELKLIVIDKISMVGNTSLLHIHQRQKKIFDTNTSQLFPEKVLLLLVIYINHLQIFKEN